MCCLNCMKCSIQLIRARTEYLIRSGGKFQLLTFNWNVCSSICDEEVPPLPLDAARARWATTFSPVRAGYSAWAMFSIPIVTPVTHVCWVLKSLYKELYYFTAFAKKTRLTALAEFYWLIDTNNSVDHMKCTLNHVNSQVIQWITWKLATSTSYV